MPAGGIARTCVGGGAGPCPVTDSCALVSSRRRLWLQLRGVEVRLREGGWKLGITGRTWECWGGYVICTFPCGESSSPLRGNNGTSVQQLPCTTRRTAPASNTETRDNIPLLHPSFSPISFILRQEFCFSRFLRCQEYCPREAGHIMAPSNDEKLAQLQALTGVSIDDVRPPPCIPARDRLS